MVFSKGRRGPIPNVGVSRRVHILLEEGNPISLVFQNIDPPIPLSARRVCPPPATKAGGAHKPGGEGDGVSIFWKTRELGLPSYSKICTLWRFGLKMLLLRPYFPLDFGPVLKHCEKITVMEYATGSLCPSYLLFMDILTVVHI